MGILIAVGITVFAALFSLFVGSLLQINFGSFGFVLTELGFALVALFGSLVYVTAMRRDCDRRHIEYSENQYTISSMFGFRMPRISYIMGGLILLFFGNILALMYGNIVMTLFPEAYNTLNDAMIESHYQGTFNSILCTIAIVPAVCEEFLFRGAIQGSLSTIKKPIYRILLTGILFGLFHVDPIRIPFATAMGIVLSYVYFRSGSIFVPIIVHFVNNAYSAIMSYTLLNTDMPPVTDVATFTPSTTSAIITTVIYASFAIISLTLGVSTFEGNILKMPVRHRIVFALSVIFVLLLAISMFVVITKF